MYNQVDDRACRKYCIVDINPLIPINALKR